MVYYLHQTAGKNTIVATTVPLVPTKVETKNGPVYIRNVADADFGILCFLDSQGNSIDPSTLEHKYKRGEEMPGFALDPTSPVYKVDKEGNSTGEETGLFWIKPE